MFLWMPLNGTSRSSLSSEIDYLEMKKSEDEQSQTTYVTFKESQGADTTILLKGAKIAERMVIISLNPDYQVPPVALAPSNDQNTTDSALRKAKDVVSSMLSRGFMLGKDALNNAKAFDEKHQLISTASTKVASLDQRFQVREKTKSAFAAAEQKVSDAGSAIMKNRYVFTGATWVTGAFNKVAKAAEEVSTKAKEKVRTA